MLTRRHWLMRLQILTWMLLSSGIVFRYGVLEQRNFYSNDQRYHAELVDSIVTNGIPLDLDWLLNRARLPYTLPATVLGFIGIEPLLALKTISLLSLLGVSRVILQLVTPNSLGRVLGTAYLSALGLIGVFFAALGLREATMMLFVAWFFLGATTSTKVFSLVCLGLLRPHLAAAVLIGEILNCIIRHFRNGYKSSHFRAFVHMIAASIIGYYVYSFGLQYQSGQSGIYGHTWGITPVIRIASNFIGLQFLTVNEKTVEFSLMSLALLRLALSETVVIPLLFTIAVLLSRRPSVLMQSVMWSFGIYVGIVTNTDFNSFRQNIPFMPIMGLVVLLAWNERRQLSQTSQELIPTAQLGR
mgnify:CR=1 FL=1